MDYYNLPPCIICNEPSVLPVILDRTYCQIHKTRYWEMADKMDFNKIEIMKEEYQNEGHL